MRIRSVECVGCVYASRCVYASGCVCAPDAAFAHGRKHAAVGAYTQRVGVRTPGCVYAGTGAYTRAVGARCDVRIREYTYNVAVRSLRRTRWVRVYASTMYTQRVRTHTRVRISRWTVVCRRCTINDEEKSFLIESCLILRDNPVCSRTLWVFCVFRNGFLQQGFLSSYCYCAYADTQSHSQAKFSFRHRHKKSRFPGISHKKSRFPGNGL